MATTDFQAKCNANDVRARAKLRANPQQLTLSRREWSKFISSWCAHFEILVALVETSNDIELVTVKVHDLDDLCGYYAVADDLGFVYREQRSA